MISVSSFCTAAFSFAASPPVAFSSLRRTEVERLGDDRVHRHERTGDRLVGADRAELEPVAGEGERARAVAVAGVLRHRRQHVDADRQRALGLATIFAPPVLICSNTSVS